MRHVDDAHDAEGDGEADRGEQQDAAEADALEQIGGEADQPQPVLDRCRARRRRPFCSSGSRSGRRGTASSRFLICGSVVPAERARPRRAALPCCPRRAAPRRGCCCIAARISGSFSAASAFSSSAAASAGGMLQRILRGGEPGGGIGAEQGQRAERASIAPRSRLLTRIWSSAVGRDAADLGAGRPDRAACRPPSVTTSDAAVRRP